MEDVKNDERDIFSATDEPGLLHMAEMLQEQYAIMASNWQRNAWFLYWKGRYFSFQKGFPKIYENMFCFFNFFKNSNFQHLFVSVLISSVLVKNG